MTGVKEKTSSYRTGVQGVKGVKSTYRTLCLQIEKLKKKRELIACTCYNQNAVLDILSCKWGDLVLQSSVCLLVLFHECMDY